MNVVFASSICPTALCVSAPGMAMIATIIIQENRP
jgi:hypothetical protein